MSELDESKTKYFVIAIILLIILGVVLVVHFNNKSLVSGEKEKENTTTTIKDVDTTKEYEYKNDEEKVIKVNKKEEVTNEVVYKSTIDENTNMIFNYKLTEEISDSDKIVSTKLSIVDSLKNNNVVGLYDISLYDINNVKKSVKDSLITISIPLGELAGYDTYKVVYIDDNNVISDEVIESKIEDDYIKFDVKHLSKYGIIATKAIVEEEKEEVIDLTKVSLDVKINDELVSDTNIYVSTTDKVGVVVKDLDKEYKLYYLLQNEENTNTYQEFNGYLFKDIETPSTYKLSIKLEVEGEVKVFEIGTVNVFDIVFVYDKNEDITSDIVVGTIIDESGIESTYENMETNKDIVIDNVIEEIVEDENINEDDELKDDLPIDSGEETDGTNIEDEKDEDLEDKATIKLNGNIYLVEKTDISELEMTGHLVIDTSEDITFAYENDKLLTSNLYTITIKSKEFSLNGTKYTYEFVNGDIVIKKLEEEQEVVVEDFSNIFNDYQINNKVENEELILEKQIITN